MAYLSVLQCVAVCCSVLQCVAVSCSVTMILSRASHALLSDCVTFGVSHDKLCISCFTCLCCSALQCVAVCCSVASVTFCVSHDKLCIATRCKVTALTLAFVVGTDSSPLLWLLHHFARSLLWVLYNFARPLLWVLCHFARFARLV